MEGRWIVVSLSRDIVEIADRKRGLVKRGTYIQALIAKAWQAGIKVDGEATQEG